MVSTSKKKTNKNKNRFNNEQIKFLETIFEAKSRPELQMKQQLATRLGLQPRQVAIWFQNRRARTKSKQIEQDYTDLKVRYDNLASKFESLKKENQALVTQLQSLQQRNGKTQDEEERQNKNCMPVEDGGLNQDLANEHNDHIIMPFYGDNNEKVDYLEEEMNVLSMGHLDTEGASSSDESMSQFVLSEFLVPSRCKFQSWDYDFDHQNDF